MSDNGKIRVTRSEILRYLSGKMSDKERNAFERELERDPFAAEAVEGLSGISPSEAEADIKKLMKLTGKRERKSPYLNYAAAAAALLMLVVSTVLLIRNIDSDESLLSDSGTIRQERNDTLKISITDSIVVETEEETITESIAETIEPERAVTAAVVRADTHTVKAAEREKVNPTTRKAATIAEVAAIAEAEEEAWSVLRIEGVVTNESGEPFPYVTIFVEGISTIGTLTDENGRFKLNIKRELTEGGSINLIANFVGYKSQTIRLAGNREDLRVKMEIDRHAVDEVVVVGFGEQRMTERKSDLMTIEKRQDTLISRGKRSEIIVVNNTQQSVYTAAIPVGGYDTFHKFVEENLNNPANYKHDIRVVVEMSLSAQGEKGRIIIRETTGVEYSLEAVRLIREGPGWMPTKLKNTLLNDTIRIVIIFPGHQ